MRSGIVIALVLLAASAAAEERVLIFHEVAGFRHESIPAAVAALRTLSEERGFVVDVSDHSLPFTDASLPRYRAVVFALTTGDVLSDEEELALTRYVRGGGGLLGIHSAADTEHGSPPFLELIGAEFASHPPEQFGAMKIEDPDNPSVSFLSRSWNWNDEWYDFVRNPRGSVHVVASLDPTSISGSAMGDDHPVVWCQAPGLGISFYTALGHGSTAYDDPLFRRHLGGALDVVTRRLTADCSSRNGAGTGLRLDRFSDPAGTNLVSREVSPSVSIGPGETAARLVWSGSVMAPDSGLWTIRLESSGAAVVELRGREILQTTVADSAAEATIELRAGERIPLRVRYEPLTPSGLDLTWRLGGGAFTRISAPQLYPPRSRRIHPQ
jgi:type 1 glutamine amidotransferase